MPKPNRRVRGPKAFQGVMVSSTFEDLKEHRAALIRIINGADLKAVSMEDDSAKAEDVIESSLAMVADSAAYVGIIAKKRGQVPVCPRRNPNKASLTELEFDEAVRLGRPILLFLMGEKHLVFESQIELKAANRKKLEAFRKRALQMGPDSKVHRVYAEFSSLEEFKEKAAKAISDLRVRLDDQHDAMGSDGDQPRPQTAAAAPLPTPPALYAEPPYIGSHEFLGRRDQLDTLNEWASPADSHPVLLFEAIGGSGKSILTWEWIRRHATSVRSDWAGRFWYSFYERGAVMADFCGHALAYITGQPLENLRKRKTAELAPLLLRHLRERPWLLVLDGLERVLVSYNRIDADELRDDEAGKRDVISTRDPCSAIRPEDDELLRELATVAPSKILLTSRLVPRVLLNSASQSIPGVLRERLPGLRPADAEELFRACGVRGDSAAIQAYLKTHCDCHPLTVGVLAGLVNHYLPARGDFDRWSVAADGGLNLDLADVDLVQKRNHILDASIDALPPDSRRLLSVIALLPESVDYGTLRALDPHSERLRAKAPQAEARFGEAIENLEKRGLLQFDTNAGRYDLHPVVRCVAVGLLASDEKQVLGQRVVDHFSARPHDPFEAAETLGDVSDGVHIVRTLLRMGDMKTACNAYIGGFSEALLLNLEAYAEVVALLRAFFAEGWNILPSDIDRGYGASLANDAAIALDFLGRDSESLSARGLSIETRLEDENWSELRTAFNNLGLYWGDRRRLAKQDYCSSLALDLASLSENPEALFRARLDRFLHLSALGRWNESDALWKSLDSMGRRWSRAVYREGQAELYYAQSSYWRGSLDDAQLVHAESLLRADRDRVGIRAVLRLRGDWRLERGEWALAAESLHEAIVMARSVGQASGDVDAGLAVAKFHLR